MTCYGLLSTWLPVAPQLQFVRLRFLPLRISAVAFSDPGIPHRDGDDPYQMVFFPPRIVDDRTSVRW